MSESCCCPPDAGNQTCELPPQEFERKPLPQGFCPQCQQRGKPIARQTINSMLALSLKVLSDSDYLFCRNPICPVVYFSLKSDQVFTQSQIWQRVFQKEPDSLDVNVCYCFQHTVGDIIHSQPEDRVAILADIQSGIDAGLCACDLRNPQGSCCLGNVRSLMKQSSLLEA